MRLQEMEALIAVNKYNSITQAAQELFITQSTLSHQIRALEEEFGIDLITHKKGAKRTALSAAGLALLPQAEKFVKLMDETRSIMDSASTDIFSFACVQSLMPLVAEKINASFHEFASKCTLQLQSLSSQSCYRQIEEGTVDAALCCKLPEQKLKKTRVDLLCIEKLVFTCRQDAPYGDFVSVSDLDISDGILCIWCPEYEQWYRHWFGGDVRPFLQIRNSAIIKSYFSSPYTWAVLPISMANNLGENFRTCELDHESGFRSLYFASNGLLPKPYANMAYRVTSQILKKIPGIEFMGKEILPVVC